MTLILWQLAQISLLSLNWSLFQDKMDVGLTLLIRVISFGANFCSALTSSSVLHDLQVPILFQFVEY